MEINVFYKKWFQTVITAVLCAFFVAAPLSSLYVFTSFLSGPIRIAAYIAVILAYGLIIYFFKDRIRLVICKILSVFSRLNDREMLIIITLTAIVMKALFTFLFGFDATDDGDVKIYNDIADQILSTGNIHTYAISHLYGVALHLLVFKLFGLPLHIGMFAVIYIGTIFNYFSFKKIIGKEKAFLIVMLFLLMPSTSMMSQCITHEIFVYMYVSAFLFFYNRFIEEERKPNMIFQFFMIIFNTILTCFVNPGGYIIYIIMILTVLLSNTEKKKKIMILAALLLSVCGSNFISDFLNIYKYRTTMNTYTILIHGSNPWSLGEQVDGYPLDQMRKYIYENTLDFSHDGFVDAAKNVLFGQYKYLIMHPVTFIRLIIHKTYILWSGVHYPIELGHFYDSIRGPVYYLLLAVNTVMYLFVVSVGLAFYKKKEDRFDITNYKLEFLGVFGLTMFCIVANKYSLYVTLFLYLIAFYRAELLNDGDD